MMNHDNLPLAWNIWKPWDVHQNVIFVQRLAAQQGFIMTGPATGSLGLKRLKFTAMLSAVSSFKLVRQAVKLKMCN